MVFGQGYPGNPPLPPPPYRLTLSSYPIAFKVCFSIMWCIIIGGWCAIFGLAATTRRSAGEESFLLLELLLALITSLLLTFLLVELYSFSIRLEGTTLAIRHAYGTRRWDLSSAVVTVQAPRGKAQMVVRDHASGRQTQLRLRRPQLRYANNLASAITATRPGDPIARQAAAELIEAARHL